MVKITCEVCKVKGTLQKVGNNYYRVRHYDGIDSSTRKLRFHYHQVSKEYAERELEKLRGTKALENTIFDQGKAGQGVVVDRKLKESSSISKNRRAGSLARLGHLLDVPPVIVDQNHEISFNLRDFNQWVRRKYAPSWAPTIICYSKKYHRLLFGNLSELDSFTESKKIVVVKALTVLSKHIGCHQEFKTRLKNYGIKLHRQNAIQAFLRIMKASDSDILDWYSQAIDALRPNEQIYLRFAKISGIRKQEAINSFNKIIELSRDNMLSEYYDSELSVLIHFKYPKLFLRRTKNCYISFVPQYLVAAIAESQEVTYSMIRKRLNRQGLKVRVNELRDYFGTYLRKHNVTKEEIDLLQGRIPSEIFIRHYWSPKLKELGTRIFKALKNIDQT